MIRVIKAEIADRSIKGMGFPNFGLMCLYYSHSRFGAANPLALTVDTGAVSAYVEMLFTAPIPTLWAEIESVY
ncbi:MAG: hypothetical protein CFH41_00211 [Alphaproteobacteria bacterium MarineAlpha11_Bin1]|nr:MAG: hypothetical protein CFH41_00211 [Alphaproteobacteria bacterium MarineAlpha11_Bin1]